MGGNLYVRAAGISEWIQLASQSNVSGLAGASTRSCFSCWEFAWAECHLIWFYFLILKLGPVSLLFATCACVHLYQTHPKINGLVLLYFAKRHREPHGNAQSTPKMSVSSLWTFYFAVLHNTCHHQTSSLTFPWSALKINRICTHDGWWIKQLIHAFMIQVVSLTWSQ